MRRIVLVGVLLGVPGSAAAQPAGDKAAQAEALNAEGKERMRVLDLDAAAEKFRKAIALSPDPRFYFNLCFTLEKLDRLREARAACQVVDKDSNADPKLREKSRTLLAQIDQRLASGAPAEPVGGNGKPVDTLADGEPVGGSGAGGGPVMGNAGSGQATGDRPQATGDGRPGGLAGMSGGQPGAAQPGAAPAGGAVQGAAAAEPLPPLKTIGFGGRLAVNNATIAFSEGDEGVDSRTGIAIGAVLLWRMSHKLAIQLEGSYSQKGAAAEEGLDSVTIAFDYFEIPVLLRYTFGSRIKGFFFGGLALGLLVNAQLITDVGGETMEQDIDDVKSTDVAAVLGGGIEIPMGAGALFADLRYWLGFTDLDDVDGSTSRNRVGSLSVGYLF